MAINVLVCVVDPDIRGLLTDILSWMGLEVTSTGDMVQALDWIRSDLRTWSSWKLTCLGSVVVH